MKNVSSLRSTGKNESPKTPGGISKSLLTPCRRVGLSRNWKKKGPSPFISPLTSRTPDEVEVKVEKRPTRKRKSVIAAEEKAKESSDGEEDISVPDPEDIATTPLRNVELPLRKKSKTFLSTLQSQESGNSEKPPMSIDIENCTNVTVSPEAENDVSLANSMPETVNQIEEVSSPEQKKVVRKSKFRTPCKSSGKVILDSISDTLPVGKSEDSRKDVCTPRKTKSDLKSCNEVISETVTDTTAAEKPEEPDKEIAKFKNKRSETKSSKTRSPNELTKECIVVIQKKLLKVKEKYNNDDKITDVGKSKESSQPLFDSDDEAPLSSLNKKEKVDKPTLSLNDDDDFVAVSTTAKSTKQESKKDTNVIKTTSKNKKPAPKIVPETKTPSQNLFDDDDDDFFDKKKTILIRKTYDKVIKPQKAKSTGSITQKDIDNLKSRIEVKKKMLMARAMTDDTEELRTLIKKWQKGCQEALMELMDLMKIKCPDKHNMDYSEILQMLKIPPALVGYDSDHDCFNTPDDDSAVLSKFNDY